jgi:hypothetical protein
MQEACQARIAARAWRNTKCRPTRPGHECRHNLNYWHFGDYLTPARTEAERGRRRAGGRRGSEATGRREGAPFQPPSADSEFQIRRRWKVRAPRGYWTRHQQPIGGDDRLPNEHCTRIFGGPAHDCRIHAARSRETGLGRCNAPDSRGCRPDGTLDAATRSARPSSAGVFSTTTWCRISSGLETPALHKHGRPPHGCSDHD